MWMDSRSKEVHCRFDDGLFTRKEYMCVAFHTVNVWSEQENKGRSGY